MGVGKFSHGSHGCGACGDVVRYSNHAYSKSSSVVFDVSVDLRLLHCMLNIMNRVNEINISQSN